MRSLSEELEENYIINPGRSDGDVHLIKEALKERFAVNGLAVTLGSLRRWMFAQASNSEAVM